VRVCAVCGTAVSVDSHHIGGRACSDITIDLCSPRCHQNGVHRAELSRLWPGEPNAQAASQLSAMARLDRIALGLLDILERFAISCGLYHTADLSRKITRRLSSICGFTNRPARALPTDPPDQGRLTERMRQIRSAWEQWCKQAGIPVTDQERVILDRAEALIARLLSRPS
jgi:hypothetical protein